MPGVSLYGREEYSFGPYSKNPRVYFDGSLTVSVVFRGGFSALKSLTGSISTSVVFTGQPEVLTGFSGYMVVGATLSGDTQIFRNSKGKLPVSVKLSGAPNIVHVKHMNGSVGVRVTLKGSPTVDYSVTARMTVATKLTGNPHVGLFWEDDTPFKPNWNPIEEKSTVWLDAGPSETPWRPI